MNKILKYSVISLIAVPVIVVIALVLFIQFQDANRFKPDIEAQAKQAGIDLSIDGSLAWSIFPLGLDLNEIQINDQQAQAFASVSRLMAEVDLFSIFKGAPSIHALVIDGAQVNLIEDKDGNTNWTNILPENKAEEEKVQTDPIDSEQADISPSEQTSGNLSFLVSRLEVTNLTLRYQSAIQNQDILLSPLNIIVSDIAPDSDIPVDISFAFEDAVQKLSLNTQLDALLGFSSDFSDISIKELSSQFEVRGPFSAQETIHARLDTQLSIDTKQESITVPKLDLALEELKLNTALDISNYATSPNIAGNFSLNKFNLKELAAKFQIALPELSDENSLKALSAKSQYTFANKQLRLEQFQLNLDETSWQGALAFNTENQAIHASLHGDKLNLDRYLPKASGKTDESNEAPTDTNKAPTPKNEQTELVPLDTIRSLDLDITFKQDEFVAKNLLVENIGIQLQANQGVITLKDLSASTHKGKLVSSAKLDARTNSPLWSANSNISSLDLGSLIQAMEIQKADDFASLRGILNLDANLYAQGNHLNDLQNSAKMTTTYNIDNGELHGINLKALNCQGLALINKESLDTSSWPSFTPFDTLTGSANLEKQVLNSHFDMSSAGLKVEAKGPVNLESTSLDLRLAMKVVGDQQADACRVNEKFKDIPIPVRCRGNFDTPPAKLCKLDSVRLREAAKDVAVEEAKRKVDKEVDRALKKHLGEDNEVKDAAKKLFKKLF